MKKIQLNKHLRTRGALLRENLRRSERVRCPKDFYAERVCIANGDPGEPRTVAEAKASKQKKQWEDAMESEMELFMQSDVWGFVELPNGRSAVGCKWASKRQSVADERV